MCFLACVFLAVAVPCYCYKEAGSSSFISICMWDNLAAALTRDSDTVTAAAASLVQILPTEICHELDEWQEVSAYYGLEHRVRNWSTIESAINVENSEKWTGLKCEDANPLRVISLSGSGVFYVCGHGTHHSIVAAGSLHIVYACPGFCAGAKDDSNEIVVRGNRGGPPFFYNRSMIIGRDDTEEREKLSNVWGSPALASGRGDQGRGNVLRVVSTVP